MVTSATSDPSPAAPPGVGELLRTWRRARRKSQWTLSLDAGVSARHVSFVESGRSRPSRDMVLTLARALEVPLRERNTLLLAAGYAPVYRESDLSASEMALVRRAVESILARQEPFPAVLLDRHWNVLEANRGAARFFSHLLDEVLAYPGVPSHWGGPPIERLALPVIPVGFAHEGRSYRFFSTVTTLGTPQDVTSQEIRIECFFPVDAGTEENLERLGE